MLVEDFAVGPATVVVDCQALAVVVRCRLHFVGAIGIADGNHCVALTLDTSKHHMDI